MVAPHLGDEELAAPLHAKNETFDDRPRRKLDILLDSVVRAAGSPYAFSFVMAVLLAWAFLGIRFGQTDAWQVVISDAQAIMCYIYDSFLVRQQLSEYEREMRIALILQSRLRSHARMLKKLEGQNKQAHATPKIMVKNNEKTIRYPKATGFQKYVSKATSVFGHVATLACFILAILIWIGIGPIYDWSDSWQLYMNSASSALMVFVFIFLASIHEQDSVHSTSCFSSIMEIDYEIESQLRRLTGDTRGHEEIEAPAPRIGRIQRAIFYYADLVGTLTGIAILIAVIIAWISVGPLLHFSANWWLIIGTYAGLIGMHDAFVLRNLQASLRGYVDLEFTKLGVAEIEISNQLFGERFIPTPVEPQSLGTRISLFLDKLSSHRYAVVLGFLTLVGLVVGSSALRWTLTGQLLCNVPPSIIESFIMIVLISGHRLIQVQKNASLYALYRRRQNIQDWIVSRANHELYILQPIHG
ncbi:hypothetical protein MBLNU13_g00802t2 [Cladosporium sp. NU13]